MENKKIIEKSDIKWKMVIHLSLKKQYLTKYADADLGITGEKITKRTKGGFGIGNTEIFYFIDNDEREFLSVEDLVNAYNDKLQLS